MSEIRYYIDLNVNNVVTIYCPLLNAIPAICGMFVEDLKCIWLCKSIYTITVLTQLPRQLLISQVESHELVCLCVCISYLF